MQETHPYLQNYYYGQLAQSTSFSIWWCLSSPIFIALLGNSGVGQVRVAFNVAVCLISPIAGGYAQTTNVKCTLLATSVLRACTYFLFLPALWVFYRSGWDGFPHETEPSDIYTAIFLLIIFIDGPRTRPK